MEPSTFRMVIEPADGGWYACTPAVPGCHTWSPSLAGARAGIREALACCVDVFGTEAEADRIAETARLDEELVPPR